MEEKKDFEEEAMQLFRKKTLEEKAKAKKRWSKITPYFMLALIVVMAISLLSLRKIANDPYGFCNEYCSDVCVSCDFNRTSQSCYAPEFVIPELEESKND